MWNPIVEKVEDFTTAQMWFKAVAGVFEVHHISDVICMENYRVSISKKHQTDTEKSKSTSGDVTMTYLLPMRLATLPGEPPTIDDTDVDDWLPHFVILQVMSLLMSIAPKKAVIADTGEVVDVDKVKVNTVLSFPIAKLKDLPLSVGTINLNGKIIYFFYRLKYCISMMTIALYKDCVVVKIEKLAEEARNNKISTYRLIDK
ncbi:hypothetical protein KIW84_062472 [Lathyrus oleraceus]|uniref:Uncharacterized protein n=1 Tax=Pisum sativum TaxID=3888 RepID=A0A9D5A5N0_PEA|nr:hypothetical protein KIW84_062472 [Pisum sativum]